MSPTPHGRRARVARHRYSPSAPLGQAPPERVGAHLLLDQLLPEHAVADNALPLLADELGGAQRTVVQVREDVLGHVVEPLVCPQAPGRQVLPRYKHVTTTARRLL